MALDMNDLNIFIFERLGYVSKVRLFEKTALNN